MSGGPIKGPLDPRLLLTPREVEALAMASQGLTNGQVAAQMNVTVHAVKFHLAAVYRKLGVGNRTEAAFMYLQAQQPRRDGKGPAA
jgi:DNA-binding CsgD family transcriptional regulator